MRSVAGCRRPQTSPRWPKGHSVPATSQVCHVPCPQWASHTPKGHCPQGTTPPLRQGPGTLLAMGLEVSSQMFCFLFHKTIFLEPTFTVTAQTTEATSFPLVTNTTVFRTGQEYEDNHDGHGPLRAWDIQYSTLISLGAVSETASQRPSAPRLRCVNDAFQSMFLESWAHWVNRPVPCGTRLASCGAKGT